MAIEIAMWLFLLGPTTMWFLLHRSLHGHRAGPQKGRRAMVIVRIIHRLVGSVSKKYCDAVKCCGLEIMSDAKNRAPAPWWGGSWFLHLPDS
jgi:hypothetical protein